MAGRKPLLVFNDCGIYCEQANVYLDPWKPVERAIISHGHADHSRWGNKQYLTHIKNVPIMRHRLGDISVEGKDYNDPFYINGVKFSLHPAGHIIGSSQIRVEYQGETWVFTGDYKTENDGISDPFEVVKCHTFITECTFALPPFNWQPQQNVFNDINAWWSENQSERKTSVIFGYTLGKAQRILQGVDHSVGRVYTHGAVENMNEVIRSVVSLKNSTRITPQTTKEELRGALVIAPPSAHGTVWLRKMNPFVTSVASGWMTFRGARARRAVDRGFVLSDHCDWYSLLDSIKATGCEKVICTHGYTDIFSRYLREIGYDAKTEHTQYEGENNELSPEPGQEQDDAA